MNILTKVNQADIINGHIELPDDIVAIGTGAFFGIDKLVSIKLPKHLKIIGERAFYSCSNLKEIIFNDELEYVKDSSFFGCKSLEEVVLPDSVIEVARFSFGECKNIKKITINNRTNLKYQGLDKINLVIANSEKNVIKEIEYNSLTDDIIFDESISLYKNENFCFFDSSGKWVEISRRILDSYDREHLLDVKYYNRLHEWIKKGKFIPNSSIIENMRVDKINDFFVNKNCKKWRSIVECASIEENYIEKAALFKLCYALGLFSVNGNESDRAYYFIKDIIIKDHPDKKYHEKYGKLDVYKNGYIKEFANLVFKNYKKDGGRWNFLISLNPLGMDSDYFTKVYNDFYKIQEAYPNKKVNTNRKTEELTPRMCIDVVRVIKYKNISKGNEMFALNMGMYGYTQEDFERAQALFEEGKNIKDNEIKLFIKKDDTSNLITYELLDKDNPLGVILGNITNCCQTIIATGKECVEYGLSKRNSKFLVFKKGNRIIGQSWVWYDEKTKKICLDNIEIPRKIFKKEFDETISEQFIECLNRCVNGFIMEMKSKGIEVESITIGEGFTSIRELLSDFKKVNTDNPLSDYMGYTDAYTQYVLYEKRVIG